ncbi:hypothetical protein P674_2520, partial [Acinetobacter baumannii UH6907]
MNYNFLSFVLTALVINLAPGPAMFYVMNRPLAKVVIASSSDLPV